MPFPPWIEPHLPDLVPPVLAGLARTWRLRVSGPGLPILAQGGCVLSFWHGRQLPVAILPQHVELGGTVYVMTSLSRDGRVQAAILRNLGLSIIDGSSSKRGARALVELSKKVAVGGIGALACDGPTGPIHYAKSGVVAVAQLAKAPILPVGLRVSHAYTLPNTWDEFMIPLPGAEVQVEVGHAIWTEGRSKDAQRHAMRRVQQAMATLNQTSPTHFGIRLE